MKRIILLTMLLITGTLIYSQPATNKFMPITTSSKSALSLYYKAMKYYDDVNLNKALETFHEALAQDKDFFMANYQLAFYYLLNRDENDFVKYAQDAINCKENLSDGEMVLKNALVSLKQGHTDLVGFGKKLVGMYPNDPGSYSNLINFESLSGDSTAMVETLKEAIEVAPDQATFYNQLGYAYLALKQGDKAKEAFDKYIELEPENPNVYDSKGDYYMYMKEYDKAYDSYMKANYMNPAFSKDKAELAKQLYENTTGKSLGIISI